MEKHIYTRSNLMGSILGNRRASFLARIKPTADMIFFALMAMAIFCFPRATRGQSQAAAQAPAANSDSSATNPFDIEMYSTKVRFDSDGTGERQLDVRIKVKTAAGAETLKTLVFPYNAAHESFNLASLQVTKANGSIVTPKPDATPPTVEDNPAPEVKDEPAFSDLREVHIHVPPLAPGDTLRYEVVTKITKPSAPGEFWFSHNFLLDANLYAEELTIDVPANRDVQLRSGKRFPPRVTAQGARKIYSWTRTRAQILSDASQNAQDNSDLPDVMLTSFANWEAVGKWLAGAEKLSGGATQDEITAKAQSLTADAKTDEDKIEALYDFVAHDIRPIHLSPEESGFLFRDPEKILKDGYGDAMDKCALLAALMGAAHFHADIALLPAKEKIDPDFAWPDALTAALLTVTAGKETYWMDPEFPAIPFRLVPPNLRNHQALVAATDGAPRLAMTPQDPPFPSMQLVEIAGRVSELGRLMAHVTYTIRGDNEFALRMAFYSTPKDQWKQVAQTMAALDGFRGEVSQVQPSDPTATRDPFVLKFDLVNPTFLDWSRKQTLMVLPLPTIGLPDAPADSKKGVVLGTELRVTTKLTLTLPVTDTAQVPVGAGLTRDFADYQSHYSVDNYTITAERTLNFRTRELPPSRTADYLAFESAVETDENQLVQISNMIPDVPADALPRDLMAAGEAALKNGQYSNAERLFARVLVLDPKHPGLWSDLGYVKLQLGDYAEAADAFRKELAANPADESVNDLLGVALFDEKQYDAAAEAFQKQIAIKPLDTDAHAYLGAVYVGQKKFQDALHELEKAAVITPDNAGVELSTGDAYLGLKKPDAALEAFNKAAAASPTPGVENEIAYRLAEAKVALPRAQQLSESAVRAAEAAMQSMDLQHLTQKNVTDNAALPAFWDTLGWVNYSEGNLGVAEAYARAAWLLGGQPDAAEHLGRIYESRGDKARATQMYLQAIAAGADAAEVRERLVGLGNLQGDINAGVTRAKTDLVKQRMVAVRKLGNEVGRAGFLVLLAAGENGVKVQDAKFFGGDDRLTPAGERLRSAKFPDLLPPGSKAKVLLRGVLNCLPGNSVCQFVYDRPADLLRQR